MKVLIDVNIKKGDTNSHFCRGWISKHKTEEVYDSFFMVEYEIDGVQVSCRHDLFYYGLMEEFGYYNEICINGNKNLYIDMKQLLYVLSMIDWMPAEE